MRNCVLCQTPYVTLQGRAACLNGERILAPRELSRDEPTRPGRDGRGMIDLPFDRRGPRGTLVGPPMFPGVLSFNSPCPRAHAPRLTDHLRRDRARGGASGAK